MIPWPYLCFSLVGPLPSASPHRRGRRTDTGGSGPRPDSPRRSLTWTRRGTRSTGCRRDQAEDRPGRCGGGAQAGQDRLPADELERVTLERFDQFEADLIRATWRCCHGPSRRRRCMSIAWAGHGSGLRRCTPPCTAATGSRRPMSARCGSTTRTAAATRVGPAEPPERALLESLPLALGADPHRVRGRRARPCPDRGGARRTRDPMTDAQRREALALVEATYEQASRDALAEAFRSR